MGGNREKTTERDQLIAIFKNTPHTLNSLVLITETSMVRNTMKQQLPLVCKNGKNAFIIIVPFFSKSLMYILKDLAAVPSRFKSIEGEAGVIRVPLYFHTPIDVIKRSMLQTMSSTSEGKQDVREPHR